MTTTFDQNLFTQIGLDSGSLTMLSSVIHSLPEPGEYRGTVGRGGEPQATFYILVDKSSPVAQANIDLGALTTGGSGGSPGAEGCLRERFTVNPKGYVLFHVTSGPGGYDIHVRKADENPKTPVFDSRELEGGDLFTAVILRPGQYSVRNDLSNARAEIIVPYPRVGKTAYRPPGPLHVECAAGAFTPRRIHLSPGQGLVFECNAKSRIKIELVKADDGPTQKRK